MPTDFKLPELGEQIAGGDVLRVLVKPGDTIAKEQAVLELETDKATIEVPSSVAGVVKTVNVKVGEKVKVGQVILTVEGDAATAAVTEGRTRESRRSGRESRRRAGANSAGREAAGRPAGRAGPGSIDGAGQVGREGSIDWTTRRRIGSRTNVVDISRGARAAAEPATPESSRRRRPRRRSAVSRAKSASTSTRSQAPDRTAASRSKMSRRTPSA